MNKEELDKYKELELVVETLVDYCNNDAGMATACEVIAVEAALERLYKARQKESEKDMTNVINKGKPAFPIVGQLQDVHEVGMTLRDYYIAHAPAAEIADMLPATDNVEGYASYIGVPLSEYVGKRDYVKGLAKARCEWADAMLKARYEK